MGGPGAIPKERGLLLVLSGTSPGCLDPDSGPTGLSSLRGDDGGVPCQVSLVQGGDPLLPFVEKEVREEVSPLIRTTVDGKGIKE